ncbi:MAG: hypothetical protein JWQ38_2954, partial [Flavipsychrobacter sp.]|nr:hypothetical protein [Flavipsychrobacter sp.]
MSKRNGYSKNTCFTVLTTIPAQDTFTENYYHMKKRSLFNFTVASIFFFAATTKVFAGPNEDLITACKQGNLEGVKKAVDGGAD